MRKSLIDVVDSVNWPLLYRQKLCLADLQEQYGKNWTPLQRSLTDGLLNFLDELTDVAESIGQLTDAECRREMCNNARAQKEKH